MSYGTSYNYPWQDTMQVCLNGHVINAKFLSYPTHNRDFCEGCGEKTITNCPNCDKPITWCCTYQCAVVQGWVVGTGFLRTLR